ncbi:NAD-dependent epimerase/dehydratase family protein [Aeromicrobium sp.]|uniref:polysaccharide biosynthesis C-terminal domain-containing protein n=1 Tax=Aeromicrobium sp. TaxID=1871063 RepID=UPI003D6A3FE1
MKVVVTGAHGFLGWHLRCRLKAMYDHEVVAVGRGNDLSAAVRGADAVIHLAAVNRGSDDELSDGNVALADAVVKALRESVSAPRVVFANSIRAGDGTPYGDGNAGASHLLRDAAKAQGWPFIDVELPNLFGEHGRPGYNSFVATFCHEVAAGREPQVSDNLIELLHAQDAAQLLIDGLEGGPRIDRPRGEPHGVVEVLDLIRAFDATYRSGAFPSLESAFEADLFNTYRSAAVESHPTIRLERRTDPRGALVEAVKAHGGGGQTFFSTTLPGATRGDHFHLRKVERFVVIGGQARIRLRRLFTDDVRTLDVSGDVPVAVDMPTMWAHDITNTGDSELLTLFWTDSVFDPDHPDTYPEPVAIDGTEVAT